MIIGIAAAEYLGYGKPDSFRLRLRVLLAD
jgi:hypothetical protein